LLDGSDDPRIEEIRAAALRLAAELADARREAEGAILQRQGAQAEASAIEARYRALFARMDQGLGFAELEFAGDAAVDLRWLDVNPQFEKVTGFSRAQLIEAPSMRALAPGLDPEWLQIFGRVARTGKAVRVERWSDYLGRWLDVNAFRLGDVSSHRIVVLVTDTTERARQVANLAFQARVADDCSRVSSVDATLRVVSERCAEYLGVRACKLVDNGSAFTPEGAARPLVVPIGQVGERRLFLAVVGTEGRTWTPGEVTLIESLGRQLHPILQRAAAEDELRSSRERLRLIVENARDYAILTTDLARRVTTWNAGAERLIGFKEEEVLGQTADIIFTEEGRAAGAPEREAETAIREGRATDERWHVRKDGSRFWGSGSMLAMRDEKGDAVGLLKILRDQTTELHAKEALERSRRELWEALQETDRARNDAEAAGRAKDQLFAVLSHELRTPLMPIMFGTEMLLMRDDVPAVVREVLVTIRRNVDVEARLVDDLLDVTRIRHGKLELMLSPMHVHDAVRGAVEVATPGIEARRQHVRVVLDAAADEVMGDTTRLKQVVWNVLKNASKFAPEGGEIRVTTRNEPARIVVEVSDDGIGVDPSMLRKIFDTFTQVDASITRTYGGLGLGLAIAKGIVERHGGEIEARSPGVGEGTTVSISLPLMDGASRAAAPG
jgi:PAS domain S-box-containing protein